MADTQIAERRIPEEISNGLVPVGSIIPFYDFNGAVTKPTSYLFCDGAVIADANSPINGQTLPDVSGRYLVGFGSDGGGDIASAAWGVGFVGNASHQVNLQHQHSFVHTHELDHTHSVPGVLSGQMHVNTSFSPITTYAVSDTAGTVQTSWHFATGSGNTPEGQHRHFTNSSTSFGPNDATTDSQSSSTTNNQLSSAQSIQPSSIRVRYIMRIK